MNKKNVSSLSDQIQFIRKFLTTQKMSLLAMFTRAFPEHTRQTKSAAHTSSFQCVHMKSFKSNNFSLFWQYNVNTDSFISTVTCAITDSSSSYYLSPLENVLPDADNKAVQSLSLTIFPLCDWYVKRWFNPKLNKQ